MKEIQDDRWGCWISLKELARLKLLDSLVVELIEFSDDVMSWKDLTVGQLFRIDELIIQMENVQKGSKE